MQELHAIVTGRVQMVMMRDFVQRSGKKLGLTGYVKNLPDGSVEVVAHGVPGMLEKLVEQLHKGSLLSKVQDVQVEWREAKASYGSFEIEY
jgi:acylphosphatase